VAQKKGFKYRFYPTEDQEAVLAKVFGHTRYVWNWALELRTDAYYEEGESLSYTDTAKRLTGLKKEKTWLREVSSVALQQKLRDLDQAFQNFFDGRCGISKPNTTSKQPDSLPTPSRFTARNCRWRKCREA